MSKLAPISVHDLGDLPARAAPVGPAVAAPALRARRRQQPLPQPDRAGAEEAERRDPQQLAKGLRISAESLYVRAGILEERGRPRATAPVVDSRPRCSPTARLTDRQRSVLLDIYESFVGDGADRCRDGAQQRPRRHATAPARSRSTKTAVGSRPQPAATKPATAKPPPPKESDMTLVTDIRKTVTDTTPVFAAVGLTDLAVEKVRDARVSATAAGPSRPLQHQAPGPRRRGPSRRRSSRPWPSTAASSSPARPRSPTRPRRPRRDAGQARRAPRRPPRTSSPRPRPPCRLGKGAVTTVRKAATRPSAPPRPR